MLTEKIVSNSLDLCLQRFRAFFALVILEFHPSFRNSVKQFATICFLHHGFRAFDDIPIKFHGCLIFVSFFDKLPKLDLGIEVNIPLLDHLFCQNQGSVLLAFHCDQYPVLGSAIPCDGN
jgi:hypothetical protein